MLKSVSKGCCTRNSLRPTEPDCSEFNSDNENIEDKTKHVHFGADRFYNTRGNRINISDLTKERLIKSRINLNRLPTVDTNVSNSTTRPKTISKRTMKNCKQIDSSCRRRTNSRKRTALSVQTRSTTKKKILEYDFCSSSLENSCSRPCVPNLSKEAKCDNDYSTENKFFTSRLTTHNSNRETKLPMVICKGKHFHLAFTRGSNMSVIPKVTKHTRKEQHNKQKRKTPSAIFVKPMKKSKITQEKDHMNIKPLSIILTRENFPMCDNKLVIEQSNGERSISPNNLFQEEQTSNLSVLSDCPSISQETTKENIDPSFYTSTPVKLGEHPHHILGSCSPMKKSNTGTVSRKFVNMKETPSELALRKSNADVKSYSNGGKGSVIALSPKQTLVEKNKIIPNLKCFSRKDASDPMQLIIDAGQKTLEAKQCPVCHMLYAPGDLQDDKTHKKYHGSYMAKLKFPVWKKERILGEFPDGRILMVVSSDAKYMLQKVKDIQQIVDKELGIFGGIQTKSNASYILFVTVDNKVAGFIVVEKISQAYRVISIPPSVAGCGSPRKVLYSERESVSALCGICRLWTAQDYRRHRIATRMLDCLRCHFIFGYLLSIEEIAFLDPSINGRQFIEKYTGTSNYLIYFKSSAL